MNGPVDFRTASTMAVPFARSTRSSHYWQVQVQGMKKEYQQRNEVDNNVAVKVFNGKALKSVYLE